MIRLLKVMGQWDTSIDEVEEPQLNSGHVEIDVRACGVCHSDIGELASPQIAPGKRLGHEIAGVVRRSNSDQFKEGDTVAALAMEGYAERIIVEASNVIPVPASLSPEAATLIEPLGCVLSGLDRMTLDGKVDAAVVGTGFMGQLLIRMLVLRGLAVTAFDVREEAREASLRTGAIAAFDPLDVTASRARSWSLVFECSGSPDGLDFASTVVSVEGQLSIVGFHQSNAGVRSVPMKDWNYRAIDVINAHTRSLSRMMQYMRRAVNTLAAEGVSADGFITHRVRFSDLPEYIRSVGNGKAPPTLKAVMVADEPTVSIGSWFPTVPTPELTGAQHLPPAETP